MRRIEIIAQPDRLKVLAHRFDSLRERLGALSLRAGPEGAGILAPVMEEAHDLASASLTCLVSALGDNRVTSTPDAVPALRAFSTVIVEAAAVSRDLAMALSTAMEWVEGKEADSGRAQSHAETIKNMGAFLAVAADRLATCSNTATNLATLPPPKSAPAPNGRQSTPRPDVLTQSQRQALQSIADGGAVLRETARGRMYVSTDDHTRITLGTYTSLARRKLVTSSTGSLYHGQAITVTARGRAALTAPAGPPAKRPAVSSHDPALQHPLNSTIHPAAPPASPSAPRQGGRAR